MERNGIEEAERGLRPLHCSDPGEGEREGRVGRKESWTAVQKVLAKSVESPQAKVTR